VPVRQYIGITMVSLNPDIAAELKMINTNFPNVEQGVLVYRVISGSPACKSVLVGYSVYILFRLHAFYPDCNRVSSVDHQSTML